MASPGAPDLYKAFIATVEQMLLSAPVGSDNAFLLPAFVKPSHNAAVTWRQCCIIRFWPPALIPGKTRDLAERFQLRAFPLFPQSVDWRRAMEPVALRNGGAALSEEQGHARKAREAVACPSESAMQAYAQHKLAATAGSEAAGDSLTKVAQAMGCNLHWDNLSFWTFAPHDRFLSLRSETPAQLVDHYLGSSAAFRLMWAADDGGSSPQLDLDLQKVQAVAALGLLGNWLSRVAAPPVIPPLERYVEEVARNESLPAESRRPMVKYMLYKALRKVPALSPAMQRPLPAPAGIPLPPPGPSTDPQPPSSLAQQYVDRLFSGRTPSERSELQDLLYLGSDRWRQLHADFRAKAQPYVKTAEILQWVKSDKAVVELQAYGINLVGEEGSARDEGDLDTAIPSLVDWSTVQWSVDHIVPVKHQGADHWRNYCLMPQRVNSAFGLRSIAKGGVPKQSVVGEAAHAAAHAFHRAWVGLMLAPELPAEEAFPLGPSVAERWQGSGTNGIETAGSIAVEPGAGHFAAGLAGWEEPAAPETALPEDMSQLSSRPEDLLQEASSPSDSQVSMGSGCRSQGEEERQRWSGEAAALDSRCELGDIGDMHLEASAGCAAMELDETSPDAELQNGVMAAAVIVNNPFERFRALTRA